MSVTAKILRHSAAIYSPDLVTMQLRYPRFIHAECKTHRIVRWEDEVYETLEAIAMMDDPLMSRNASSSRAIPVARLIDEALNDPAMPVEFHYNQPGMQGTTRMTAEDEAEARAKWLLLRDCTVEHVKALLELNPHKQTINRLLEPFTHISTVVTATEWSNFFNLRCHPDADPTMRHLAVLMREAIFTSTPTLLKPGQWHLPYVSKQEHVDLRKLKLDSRFVSSARCARVSYLNHDGTAALVNKDIELAGILLRSKHMSPFEHQATPTPGEAHGVLTGWRSLRSELEGV